MVMSGSLYLVTVEFVYCAYVGFTVVGNFRIKYSLKQDYIRFFVIEDAAAD